MTQTMPTFEELLQLKEEYERQKTQRKGANANRAMHMATLRFKEKKTLQEIATQYGLTRQRIHAILQKFK